MGYVSSAVRQNKITGWIVRYTGTKIKLEQGRGRENYCSTSSLFSLPVKFPYTGESKILGMALAAFI
jgi:hypothetical protein